MFCRSLFVLLYFSFGHCLVCSSSIYGFWLPFWYPQTVLNHATFYYSNCNKLGNLAVKYLYVTRVDFGPFCGFAIGKNRQDNGQKKSTKGQTTIYKTYKTKARVIRTPLKPEGEPRCSGRVGSSCSTSGTRRVNLVTNTVISRERGKDLEVFTSGTYPWSFVVIK
jgi:hypothetical protein